MKQNNVVRRNLIGLEMFVRVFTGALPNDRSGILELINRKRAKLGLPAIKDTEK